MDNTSEAKPTANFATELVTPFFNRAQIYAFSLPPSRNVIEKVNKGGQQDYIPHEYIRALLDRYIGPGRWEMRAELHSTDKEIVKKWDNRKQVEVENIAATANVNVSLVIHAQDGTDRTLEFSAVGSNTQYAGVDKGYGAIIGNAISSAESLGLKRAATNLGKAFGFDLRSKVKKSDLPPTIAQLAADLNEKHAKAQAGIVNQAAPAQPALAAAPAPAPVTVDAAPVAPKPDPIPAPAPKADPVPAAKVDAKADATTATAAAPAAEAKPVEAKPVEATAPVSSPPADVATQPTKPADEDWELSLVPGNFDEWIRCISTMSRRVNAMVSEQEVQNFIRRNKKLIDKLPVIPASDGKPERNFKKRWMTIINKRCSELQIDVPAEYRLEPVPA